MNSHYRTLGVDPDADPVVIRSAYLALMRQYHPDRGAEADQTRAQAVTAAWEVLRDPERRAAYDGTRAAKFLPGGAVALGPKVRGGSAGRNLFLLLAAATVGLGWWALGQPQLSPPAKMVATDGRTEVTRPIEPEIRPEEDRQAMHRRIAVAEQSVKTPPPDATTVDEPIEIPPPQPITQPPRLSARAPELPKQSKREPMPLAAPRPRPLKAAAPTPNKKLSKVELAPLERHQQLLFDQSMRFGTEAKRSRLRATRETFVAQLRSCDDDGCKRDAYLRRNAEISEIMRN